MDLINGLKNMVKSLTGRTSSTYATDDLVPIYSADGNSMYKISKADLMEAVRLSLGPLLANNDKGTSASRVPVVDSLSSLGSMTMANLATVLGVGSKNNETYFFNQPTDQDTGLKGYGIYIVQDWTVGSCAAYLVSYANIVLLGSAGAASYVTLTKEANGAVRITSTHRGAITTLL